jgi:hypothetical protein
MTTSLLLDTCAAIWIANDQPIAQVARDAIINALNADEPIFVSPISDRASGVPRANKSPDEPSKMVRAADGGAWGSSRRHETGCSDRLVITSGFSAE